MILVIDNYDSFTYNLVQYLGELCAQPRVVRNDAIDVAGVAALQPERIVISPGPGTPDQAGVSLDVIRRLGAQTPILGVCLGHQAIGQAFGGTVARAKIQMHGKTSEIHHDGQGVFAGLPSPMMCTRYHSLVVPEESLPQHLVACAWTRDADHPAELMAVRHRDYPVHGVQFHPESYLSPHGTELLKNFLKI